MNLFNHSHPIGQKGHSLFKKKERILKEKFWRNSHLMMFGILEFTLLYEVARVCVHRDVCHLCGNRQHPTHPTLQAKTIPQGFSSSGNVGAIREATEWGRKIK